MQRLSMELEYTRIHACTSYMTLKSDASTCRVRGAVSQPSLVEAHRNLLRAALTNPRNTMFLLISEVCVPLHHPALLWVQLMAEAHISRVDDKSEDMQRFQAVMGFGAFRRKNFQKSSQWVSLTRMHAALVAYDDYVWPRFDNFCRTGVRSLALLPNDMLAPGASMKYQTGTYGIGTIDLTALRLCLELLSLCRDQHIHFDLLGSQHTTVGRQWAYQKHVHLCALVDAQNIDNAV